MKPSVNQLTKSRPFKLGLTSTALASLLLLAACGSKSADAATAKNITVSIPSQLMTLDPTQDSDTTSGEVLNNVSRGTLFRHPFVTLFRPETTLFRRTNVTFLIFNLVIRQIIPSVGLEY